MLYSAGIIFLILISTGLLYKLKPQSANGRLLIWKVSCNMIQDKPWTGFGKGGFAANYLYYQADYMKSSASPAERKLAGSTHLTFNEPIRIIVEHGIIGFIIYFIFIIWLLFISPNKKTVCILHKSILIGIVTWGICGYPDQVFSVQTLWVVALAYFINKSYGSIYKYAIPKSILLNIAIATIFVTNSVLGLNLWAKWTTYHQLYVLTKSHSIQQLSHHSGFNILLNKGSVNDISLSYLHCQIARINRHENVFFSVTSFLEKSFPTPGLWVMKGDYLKELGKNKEAEEAYTLASYMMPSLQTPRGKLAFLYNEIGRKKEAMEIGHNILTEDVKIYNFSTYDLHRDLKRIFEDNSK